MRLLPLSILTLLTLSCGQEQTAPQPPRSPIGGKEIKQGMMEVNKRGVETEELQITKYLERKGITMQKTSTGLRYVITKKDPANNPLAVSGQVAFIEIEAKLLDGKLCYSTEAGSPTSFKIGQDNVETGLHQALKLMRVGDEATFILPSHLGHGVVGDMDNNIPPLTPVVYSIKLIRLNK